MVAEVLLPAIRATIHANEIGAGSPYVLDYARKGKSGASFGFMQGDTNVSDLARRTLRQVLAAADADQATIDRILSALSRALPNGDPLTAVDAATANGALGSARGREIVDDMDNQLMQTVLTGLDTCEAAAATRAMTLTPIAHLYIAPWINMSGAPTLMNAWLKGAAVHGVPAPIGPQVQGEEVVAYLQSLAYFQTNPKNFKHYEECVTTGAGLLPQA